MRRRNSDGLSARGKLIGQAIVSGAFAIAALYGTSTNGQTVASEHISFIRDISWLDVGKVGSVIVFLLYLRIFFSPMNSNFAFVSDCESLSGIRRVRVFVNHFSYSA